MRRAAHDPTLAEPLRLLAETDRDLARALALCGLPPKRGSRTGLTALVAIVVGQQVSTASARAILKRLHERVGRMTPQALLALDADDRRAIGLSRQKALYLQSLADDILAGRLSLRRLATLDDEAAIEHLIQAKGLGRWSAEIYLLFALRRPDVMPAGDLALQVAAQRLKALDERPSARRLYEIAQAWRPHRSAAARFLWHYYRHSGVAGV